MARNKPNLHSEVDFLERVHLFEEFADVSKFHFYSPLPDTWEVVIADIRSSTEALRLGRYKAVNMAGVSVIAALCNYFRPAELPYFFGGDGCAVCLPGGPRDEVEGILAYCRDVVKSAYDLDLHIGMVSMRELREQGHDLKLARQRLSEWVYQTVFWGSGLRYAESLLKDDRLEPVSATPKQANFEGLECRWKYIPSKHDEVVALIVQAYYQSDDESEMVYRRVLQRIKEIYGDAEEYHPIFLDQLHLTSRPSLLLNEVKFQAYPASFYKRMAYLARVYVKQLAGAFLMGTYKKTDKTDWGRYKTDLRRNSDTKKFNFSIQTVISGSVLQRLELTEYLESEFGKGKLVYGMHSSFGSMITCFVNAYHGKHIHFVDCAEGGYAKAAQALKNRIKQREATGDKR